MAFPLTTYNPNDLIYGYMLASRFRAPWVYDPSNALLKEPDIWEIIRNDSDILSSIMRRNQSIVRAWRVIANPHAASHQYAPEVGEHSQRLAAVCNEGLSSIDRFDAARVTLAEAFFLGRRYAEIEFEERVCSLDGSPDLPWFIPVRVKDVDRRRFHWVPDWAMGKDGVNRKVGVHLDMFDTNSLTWIPLDSEKRRRFIEYVWNDTEDRIGGGRGALEAAFFTHYFKSGSIKKLLEYIDKLANGLLIGKLNSLRAASTDMSNDVLTTKMKEFLQKIRTEHVGILEEGDTIEPVEISGTGQGIILEAIRYWNESFERLCNGGVRQSGHSVDGTGARAAAETEADTGEAWYQFPREDLDAVIDRDLLGAFLYYNEHNLAGLGLEMAKRPRFTSAQERKQDPLTRLQILKLANEMVPILQSEVYDAANATPPGEGDEVVEKAEPAGAGGFGGSPFGNEKDEKDKKPEKKADAAASK